MPLPPPSNGHCRSPCPPVVSAPARPGDLTTSSMIASGGAVIVNDMPEIKLDATVVNEEMAAGPRAWKALDDPFPSWR